VNTDEPKTLTDTPILTLVLDQLSETPAFSSFADRIAEGGKGFQKVIQKIKKRLLKKLNWLWLSEDKNEIVLSDCSRLLIDKAEGRYTQITYETTTIDPVLLHVWLNETETRVVAWSLDERTY